MAVVLHTADTHLGYRQYHKPERQEDFRKAFESVIDEAIEREVDAVVHAGDLFHDRRPGIEPLSNAFDELRRLADHNIPFLIVVGNHDGTRNRQWADLFEDLGLATRLGKTGFELDGITFYGLDHVERGQRDKLDYQYEQPSTDTAVLVGHGLFTPFPNGNWDSETIFRQSNVEFDALLAGDDHTPQTATVGDDDTIITYPGSTERTAADQREPRGYNVITFDDEIDVSREEMSTRTFDYIDLEMDDGDGTDRVTGAVRDYTTDFDNSVVIVTLTGAGKRVPAGPVEEAGLDKDALVVRVNDRREFNEETADYDDIDFADPDAAVHQRRRDLELSTVGAELETVARDTDEVPDSKVADVIEERVGEMIDDRETGEFTDTADELATDSPDDANGTPDTTADTDAQQPDADPDAGTLPVEEHSDSPTDPMDDSSDDPSAESDEDESFEEVIEGDDDTDDQAASQLSFDDL